MELNKSNKKEYDLSSIQELFNEMESPRQLADDLAQLMLPCRKIHYTALK